MPPLPWRSAVHEAGHILVAIAINDPFRIKSANIIADESLGRGGYVESEVVELPEATEDQALAACLILLGGWGGEYIVFKEHSRNATTDTEQVRSILTQLEPEESLMVKLWHRCMNTVLEILDPNEESLLRLARTLEVSRAMTRDQIFSEIDGSLLGFSIPWDILRHGHRD